jgi:hypothetical protein
MMLTLAFPTAKNMPVEATPSPLVLAFTFLVSLLTGIANAPHAKRRFNSKPSDASEAVMHWV